MMSYMIQSKNTVLNNNMSMFVKHQSARVGQDPNLICAKTKISINFLVPASLTLTSYFCLQSVKSFLCSRSLVTFSEVVLPSLIPSRIIWASRMAPRLDTSRSGEVNIAA